MRAHADLALAAAQNTAALEELTLTAVRRWAAWSSAWIAAGRRADADALWQAIGEVNERLREQGLSVRPRGLNRETFTEGGRRVEAWQWFEPISYYPDGGPPLRWITFWVYDGERRVARFDLEYSNLVGPFFVLGGASGSQHAQFVPYGSRHPTYWTVREATIRVMRGEREASISSTARPTTQPEPPADTPTTAPY